MIKTLNSLDKGGNIIDLTGAAADYPLQVGETATITYTSATSVPLRVATVEGLYELYITSNMSTATNNNGILLRPNNINLDSSTQFVLLQTFRDDAGTQGTYAAGIFPQLASGLLLSGTFIFHTATTAKCVRSSFLQKDQTDVYRNHQNALYWKDTTTGWSSLGTITFPFAQSGKIVIRRTA